MNLPPPVQYTTTSDGINVAYTVCGEGPPLVFVPNLINHVLLSWQLPQVGAWMSALSERFTLVRYDSRGMGMSTRGLRDTHVFEDYQLDLEAVVTCLGLTSFVLGSQGSAGQIAVRYAVSHPERVKALVMVGCSTVQGLRAGELIFRTLPEQDWEMFLNTTARLNSPALEVANYVEVLRQSATQADWLSSRRGRPDDHEAVLAQVRVPTLVLHPRDFTALPVEEAMKVAQLTRGQLVVIDGADNYGDPEQGMRAVDAFLANLSPGVAPLPESTLSAREVEVLRLIAAGRSNQQIADELVISLNTVRRHVANIFDKTGAVNRADATSYAHRKALA